MSEKDEFDVLDSLLDSINNDDTMEKKINDFARTKQRKKRIERARERSADFQSQYSTEAREKEKLERKQAVLSPAWQTSVSQSENQKPSESPADAGGDTMVVPGSIRQQTPQIGRPADAQPAPDPGDGTMVFRKDGAGLSSESALSKTRTVNAEDEGEDSTVYMNEDEIQNLLENEEPLLRREYIRSDEDGYQPENRPGVSTPYQPSSQAAAYGRNEPPKQMSWKWPVIVFGIILGAFLIYGGIQLFNNYMANADNERTEERERLFEQVKAWAEKYDSYSNDEKKNIVDYEKMFNKLDDEQKRKINEILMNASGKNFDELLALAKSDDKQNTNSNMTQIAEQKAQLRQKIQDLKDQRDAKQADLNRISSDLTTAETALNNSQSALNQAQNDYESARAETAGINTQLNQLASDASRISSSIAEINQKISDLQNSSEDIPDRDQQLSDLQEQLNEANEELQENQSDQAELNSSLSEKRQNESYYKGIYDSALSDYNAAKDTYDQQVSASNADGLQAEINELNRQINEAQAELDSLN